MAMSCPPDIFFKCKPLEGETQEQAENRCHAPRCQKKIPILKEHLLGTSKEDIRVGRGEVHIALYDKGEVKNMNIYADHTSPESCCYEDIVIAIEKDYVLFARLHLSECEFCIKASCEWIRFLTAATAMCDIGDVRVFLLVPSRHMLGTAIPIYTGDYADQIKHFGLLRTHFLESERWLTQYHPYFVGTLDQKLLPKIVQVGNYNKDGTPSVRINDLYYTNKVISHNATNQLRFVNF